MTCDHQHNKTAQCDTCYSNIYNGKTSEHDEVTLDDLR